MYQRYFKQRKFGKIFSFALIVGSGLSHYIRLSKNNIKSLFTVETVEKYQSYLPVQIEETLDYFKKVKENGNKNENSYFMKKTIEDNVNNNIFLINNNLPKRVNMNDSNDSNDSNDRERIYQKIYSNLDCYTYENRIIYSKLNKYL
jgi:hypothetical protein